MTREWKTGDVAMVRGDVCVRLASGLWEHGRPDRFAYHEPCPRPLVVIDPEDGEQVERLEQALTVVSVGGFLPGGVQAALREFADPKPDEPTDPTARVVDRRENVWRLLADGDWVCTSGPDIGEYLVWSKLAAERGPLSVEVTP